MVEIAKVIPLAAIDERVAEIKAEIEKLTIEQTLLARLRRKAIPATPSGRSAPLMAGSSTTAGKNGSGTKLLGITHAIGRLLRESPGTHRSEIPNLIRDIVKTSSSEPTRTIQTTLFNMSRRGSIRIDEGGYCYALEQKKEKT